MHHPRRRDRSAQYLALLPRAHAHEVRALLLHLLVLLLCALVAAAAAASACSKARATKPLFILAADGIAPAWPPLLCMLIARLQVRLFHSNLGVLAASGSGSNAPLATHANERICHTTHCMQTPPCHALLTPLAIDRSRAQVGQFRRFFRVASTSSITSSGPLGRMKSACPSVSASDETLTRTSDGPSEPLHTCRVGYIDRYSMSLDCPHLCEISSEMKFHEIS